MFFGRSMFSSRPHYIHHRKYVLKLDIYVITASEPDIRADITMNCYETFVFYKQKPFVPGVSWDLGPLVLLQNV